MNYVCRYCGAKAEHMGFGELGVEHSYSCPRYDGDHLDNFSRKDTLPDWISDKDKTTEGNK